MATAPTNTQNKILLALGKIPTLRIFRNNVGKCWIGKSVQFYKPQQVWVKQGDVLVQNARFFNAGLCVGSTDLIGLQAITITQEMVGNVIGRFTAIEVKHGTGRATNEQKNFIKMANDFGGLAYVAKDEFEAVGILNDATK